MSDIMEKAKELGMLIAESDELDLKSVRDKLFYHIEVASAHTAEADKSHF